MMRLAVQASWMGHYLYPLKVNLKELVITLEERALGLLGKVALHFRSQEDAFRS